MTEHETGQSRLGAAATLIAATAALGWAAIWNGYPLVWPDTGGYIFPVNLVFRSVFYNLLVAPLTGAAGSLWPIVFFQAFVVAYVMRLVLQHVFGEASQLRFVAVVLAVSALTSLPWVAGLVMADIYAPVVVLSVFLLAFCADRLSRVQRLLLAALLLAACSVHLTHPILAAGLLMLFAAYRWVRRQHPGWPAPRLVMPAIPVVLSAVLLVGNNAIVHHEARYSIGGYAFLLARLIADGPALDYLRESCPVRHYALCDYLEELPHTTSSAFLWSRDSPFRKLGGFIGYRNEGREILDATLQRYPGRIAGLTAANGIRQMFRLRVRFASYLDQPRPTKEIRDYFPADFAAYASSRQNLGTLQLRDLWRGHAILVAIGWLACAGLLPLLLRQGRSLAALLLLAIAGGYVLNAFITALSGPEARYGARVAWMIPFFCLAWLACVLRAKRDRG